MLHIFDFARDMDMLGITVRLITAMVSGGDIGILFKSPVSWVLIVLSIVGIFSPFLMNKFEKKVAGVDLEESTESRHRVAYLYLKHTVSRRCVSRFF